MNTNANVMKLEAEESKIGSAANRRRRKVLSEILYPSTQALLKRVNFQKGMCGLDLACGTGDNTLLLKTFVGAEGKMTGIDSSAVNIKIAAEKALQNKSNPVDYRLQNILEWKEEQVYDFIYSRLLFNQLKNPLTILEHVHNSLKPGGFAIAEDLDFSKFHCFPNNYAFDRFVEFYTEIKKRQGADANVGNRLFDLFQQAGFSHVQVQSARPVFLTTETKSIASLTLESIAPLLLKEQLTTATELQFLIYELKSFEGQKNTMIAVPGIYQVVGYKL